MFRSDCEESESIKACIAEEITNLLRGDGYVRRLAGRVAGGEEGWRDLVTPVWMRVRASKVDFCSLDEDERRRFLKRQVRWALKDLFRPSSTEAGISEGREEGGTDHCTIPDPTPTGDDLWTGMEDRRRLEAIVREAWQAIPAFDRAVLALYAGHPCEHDATVQLAARVGLGIVELVTRTRKAKVLEKVTQEAALGRRGGRRGRQGALAEVLGVTPSCLHQWNCRARTAFLARLRTLCKVDGRLADGLPTVLERVLG
jgi:hypothetical protein